MHLHSRIYTTIAWKKLCFILSDRSDFHMTNNQSIPVHTFASRILMSFSVDEMWLLRYMNLSTSFREPPFSMEMSLFRLKHIKTHVLRFICICMEPKDSAWVGVFTRSTRNTWKHIIICNTMEYLKTYKCTNYLYYIRILNMWLCTKNCSETTKKKSEHKLNLLA